MEKTGTVSQETNNKINNSKVYLLPEDIINKIDIYEQEKTEQLSIIKQLNEDRVLNIRYEDYFYSHESIINYNKLIFEFLGVKPINESIESYHKKLLSKKLSDLIENYDEIYNYLINTKYNKFL